MVPDSDSTMAVLVVDDEIRSLEALRRTLEEDFQVFTAADAEEACQIMEVNPVAIVLTDQRMPGTSGVELLEQIRVRWPETVRLILSGYSDSEDIINAVNRAGIYQYLLKPWQPDQLLLTMQRAAELYTLQQENDRLARELRLATPALRQRVDTLRSRVRENFATHRIVRAPDSPMNEICKILERASTFDVSILLSGESGTGKELLARAIHFGSARADNAFVVENCGALADTLLESELFGHKRGSFTGAFEDRVGLFQQAHGGTLFLDEISETSPMFQVKLLRVLQEGEFRPVGSNKRVSVDVRVVAATNRDLEQEVRVGRFREDLYFRLSTIPITLPPLRARPQDIPLLARRILERVSQTLKRPVIGFEPAVESAFLRYSWPGNVRELVNEIQRMLVLSDESWLSVSALPPHLRNLLAPVAPSPIPGALPSTELRQQVQALEAEVLLQTLQRHAGNISRAARELGLSRLGLRTKLQRLGVHTDQLRHLKQDEVG